jgi:type II secretory pathway pseudopilin PulG
MLIRFLPKRSRSDDGGWAMLTVIGSMLVMTVFATVALAVVTNGMKTARRDQSFQAALQAASAGVDDYVARLQLNPNYFTQGNTDATNPAMSGYTTVPGATTDAQFKYTVDSSQTLATGVIKLTASGKVRNTTRTVTVQLGKKSFLNYMYFTRYETVDPIAYPTGFAPPANTCDKHSWSPENRPAPANGNAWCSIIRFIGTDVLKGPVHSQDQVRIQGNATFQGEFSTEWNDPAGKYWVDYAGSGSNPSFAQPPNYSVTSFPSTNTALRQYADVTQGGTGCIFQGPTRIVMQSNATWLIQSPKTPSTFNTGKCGTRNWSTPQSVSNISGEVIYVDGFAGSCTTPIAGFPFPATGDTNSLAGPAKLQPSCNNGDVFVEGWVKGQYTIGSANNIFLTNHIRYVGTNTPTAQSDLGTSVPTVSSTAPNSKDTAGSDLLGLSASNFIALYHPMQCTGSPVNCTQTSPNVTTAPYPLTNVQIDAALVASADSVLVQDWDSGPDLGVLTVVGGIIQTFRGAVGTTYNGGTTGYDKNYNYDGRLKTLTPPHLADLAASSWGVVTYGEGKP